MQDNGSEVILKENLNFGDYSIMTAKLDAATPSPPASPTLKKKRKSSHHHHHHDHHHHHVDYDPMVHGPLHYTGSIHDAKKYRPWLIYNEHIHKGYRINFLSYRKLMYSSCQLHNETTNFWSHFLGALLFIFLFFYFSVYYAPLKIDFEVVTKAENYANSDLLLSQGFTNSLSTAQNMFQLFNDTQNNTFIEEGYSAIQQIVEEIKLLESSFKENLKNLNLSKIEYYS